MTGVGEIGEWDEEAFLEALKQFDPETRERVERLLREDKDFLLRMAKL